MLFETHSLKLLKKKYLIRDPFVFFFITNHLALSYVSMLFGGLKLRNARKSCATHKNFNIDCIPALEDGMFQ